MLAVLLVPTDPEVFDVPLHSIWWGTLLVVLELTWDDRKDLVRHRLTRAVFLVVGGLSTPLIIGLTPLYVLRAWSRRCVGNIVSAAIGLGVAAVQLAHPATRVKIVHVLLPSTRACEVILDDAGPRLEEWSAIVLPPAPR